MTKRRLTNIGGLILFYLVLVIGVLLLNYRFEHLNNQTNSNINNSYVAMNK